MFLTNGVANIFSRDSQFGRCHLILFNLLVYQESPEYLRGLIRKTRTLTDKPFGIGLVLAFPHKENLKAILDEKVAVLQVYWGECTEELVLEAHQAGVKVVPQVSIVCLFFTALMLSYHRESNRRRASNFGTKAPSVCLHACVKQWFNGHYVLALY